MAVAVVGLLRVSSKCSVPVLVVLPRAAHGWLSFLLSTAILELNLLPGPRRGGGGAALAVCCALLAARGPVTAHLYDCECNFLNICLFFLTIERKACNCSWLFSAGGANARVRASGPGG